MFPSEIYLRSLAEQRQADLLRDAQRGRNLWRKPWRSRWQSSDEDGHRHWNEK
jgi:hypothetical protein